MMAVAWDLICAATLGAIRACALIVLVAMMVMVIMEQPAVGVSLLGSWIVWRVTSRIIRRLNEGDADYE